MIKKSIVGIGALLLVSAANAQLTFSNLTGTDGVVGKTGRDRKSVV